ncbi:MAG: class II aldolase/adducin family protein [Alphaproteobacteria bacterium]|nr:class II aldolase/adducin family protein [Alphaproteobacteria bacterium]
MSRRSAELRARQAIVAACRAMNALGINQGTSGNISVRHGTTMLISPSAVPYEQMTPEQIAAMPVAGEHGAWAGPLPPSTEWRMHRAILRARPEAGAVVHGHPPYATALAITRREIPPCHYMVAAFGGATVRCAAYATYGTAELAQNALVALEGRDACLLANHGTVVCGPTLARAMWLAVELETLARQYWHALVIGGPVLLSHADIAATAAKLGSYGLRDAPSPPPRPASKAIRRSGRRAAVRATERQSTGSGENAPGPDHS